MIADTWKIRNTTAANEHNCVLLEVVTFTANVCPNFLTVSQTNTSDFAESGVWFLWSLGSNLDANATLERSGLLVIASFERIHD
jgi:hypothetical protein